MGAPELIVPGTASGTVPVGGSGTTNYLAKWLTGTTLTDSLVFDNGTSVGIGMTSGIPGRLGVWSQNNIATADLTFSFDATGSYRHGFSNVFSSITAANNTSSWLVWNAAGGLTNVVTARGDGNVGIGTTSPYAKASVRGGANDGIGAWSTSGTTAGSPIGASLFLGDDNFYNSSFYNKAPGLSSVYDAAQGNAAAIAFYSYNGSRVECMRIDSSGFVGIGTASPASKLDVAGTITCDDDATGLKLPATPGNADTQTLDCYQENTWTPTLAGFGGTAPTVNSASYTCIGRLVYFNIFLVATGGASYSGTRTTTTISLPFQTAGGQALVNMMDANVNALGSGLIATNSGGVIFLPTFALTTTNTFISGWYQV